MRFLLVMVLGLASAPGCRGAEEPTDTGVRRHALLVGCTWYRNVPGAFLEGPANDLKLMRRMLVDQFQFDEGNIRVLDDNAEDDAQLPTRSNIEREFRELAKVAQRDDDVVIYLAGHGAFQPDNDPENPEDAELDGRDEVFCPTDVARITGSNSGPIPNAISDDEIHVWLDRILAKEASVWFIVDACHSGTVMRGNDETKDRAIPAAKLGIDPDCRAAKSAGTRRSASPPANGAGERTFELTAQPARIVATYAAQPSEPTPELALPKGARDRQMHGLFTYTLTQVLTETQTSLTYRELMARVHAQYVQWGYSRPNPAVEGPDSDREVLGKKKWPARSRILLRRDERNRFRATAGVIGGLADGTILAVYPPPGKTAGDEPLGYVRVDEARMLESAVKPCSFQDVPARNDLPEGGRCEVAQINYGDGRLQVSLDTRAFAQQEMTAQAEQLRGILQDLEKKDSRIEWTDDLGEADWLLRPWKNDVYLIPAAGLPWQPGDVDLDTLRPIPSLQPQWLDENLLKIARAENLLKIGSQAQEEKQRGRMGAELDVQLEIVKLSGPDQSEESPLRWGPRGRVLDVGEKIHIRVKNSGQVPVDVTVLFVDSGYGITPLNSKLIKHAPPDNRLRPGEEDRTISFRVTPSTIGLEHIVVIAVRGRGEIPVDFSWLQQPTVEDLSLRGGAEEGVGDPNSPLGPLLQGMYSAQQLRGLEPERTKEAVIEVLSWRTVEE